MPYKDIGAFRRAYRAEEGSFAHERSHHLIRDQKDYAEVRRVLSGSENLPKSLAEFQELRYNKNKEAYQKLQREKHNLFSSNRRNCFYTPTRWT